MKRLDLFENLLNSRREFLAKAIQAIAATLSLAYLGYNEQRDREQEEALGVLSTSARRSDAMDISTIEQMVINDMTLFNAVNITREELGLALLLIKGGRIVRP